MESIREKCEEKPECSKLKLDFSNCEERVSSKSNTAETCAQELLDFLHCRDHCVSIPIYKTICFVFKCKSSDVIEFSFPYFWAEL